MGQWLTQPKPDAEVAELLHILKPRFRPLGHAISNASLTWNPLSQPKPSSFYVAALARNSNPRAFDHYLKWHKSSLVNPMYYLALNSNNKAVEMVLEYLKTNPQTCYSPKIDCLSSNPHPKVIQYLTCHHSFGSGLMMDDGYNLNFGNVCHNPHPVAVNWCLKQFKDRETLDFDYFCNNPNVRALDYYLSCGGKPKGLVCNSNPRAVDLYLQFAEEHPDQIRWDCLVKNKNVRALNFVLDHCPDVQKLLASEDETPFTAENRYLLDLFANPGIFKDDAKLSAVYLWTHCESHVFYRLPLELVRMVTDFC